MGKPWESGENNGKTIGKPWENHGKAKKKWDLVGFIAEL